MQNVVISAENIALLDLLDETRKAKLLDAICSVLRGREVSGLDDATRIVFASIVRDNEKVPPITKSSQTLDVIPTDQERIKEKVCTNVHTEKKKERIADSLIADEGVAAAFEEFRKMRKKIKKPLTDLAEKRALEKLERLSDGDPTTARLILEQSCDYCWQGLFELKDEVKSTSNQPNQRNPKIQNAYGFGTERKEVDYNALAWQQIRERWKQEDAD